MTVQQMVLHSQAMSLRTIIDVPVVGKLTRHPDVHMAFQMTGNSMLTR